MGWTEGEGVGVEGGYWAREKMTWVRWGFTVMEGIWEGLGEVLIAGEGG